MYIVEKQAGSFAFYTPLSSEDGDFYIRRPVYAICSISDLNGDSPSMEYIMTQPYPQNGLGANRYISDSANDYESASSTVSCSTLAIVSGSAIAPTPVSPQAKVFAIGAMTVYFNSMHTCKCFDVKGCSHMKVFIAGHITTGFDISHARRMDVRRLSQSPFAILASVFADNGATTRASAQFRNYVDKIC